ncbi:MAG: hypothetical protein WA364_30220 [Candidatus Nitrosopolaris sp.]
MSKREKILTVILLGIIVAYGWYQVAYGISIPMPDKLGHFPPGNEGSYHTGLYFGYENYNCTNENEPCNPPTANDR